MTTLPWAADLGPPPTEPEERSAWLTAATAVTAYRERFEVPDYVPMTGARPADSRPDARAAWDHARLQADRYLARRLRHLSDDQLDELDTRHQVILDHVPRFDPADLRRRRELNAARGIPDTETTVSTLAPRISRAEIEAAQHATWRKAAAEAATIRAQVQLERERRLAERHRLARATG